MPGLFFGDIVTLKSSHDDAQYVFVGTYYEEKKESADDAAAAVSFCVFVQTFHIRTMRDCGNATNQDILSFFVSIPLNEVFSKIESPLPVILAVDNYFSALSEEDRTSDVISGALFKAYFLFVGDKEGRSHNSSSQVPTHTHTHTHTTHTHTHITLYLLFHH